MKLPYKRAVRKLSLIRVLEGKKVWGQTLQTAILISRSAPVLSIHLQNLRGRGGAVSPLDPLSSAPESLSVHYCVELNPFGIK